MSVPGLSTSLVEEVDAVIALLEGAPVDAWDLPTRCPPWAVRDLVAHLAIAPAVLANACAAWATEQSTADPEAVDPTLSPGAILQTVRERRDRLADEVAMLTEADLDSPFPADPVRGLVLPGRAVLRLALVEIGIHRSDLAAAVGGYPSLSSAVIEAAAEVVPTWLIFGSEAAKRPKALVSYELTGQTAKFSFTYEHGWTLEETPQPAASLAGSDSDVILFLFGRIGPNALTASGDLGLAARLKDYLPGP